MIVQPTNLTLHQWADAVVLTLNNTAALPKLLDDDWQRWGTTLLVPLESSSGSSNLPDPHSFSDWFDWASRLCEELS